MNSDDEFVENLCLNVDYDALIIIIVNLGRLFYA